jgi:hypothetical protein
VHDGHFPGLYLLITGTPAFFEGRQGIPLLPPLADRLHTQFAKDPRFDNPRAPQLRLTGFDQARLVELGTRVRDLYVSGIAGPERLQTVADDAFLERFATAIAGGLGGKVGIAPRLFLRKLVDVLDKIDQFHDFDPSQDYEIRIAPAELSDAERAALTADDVALDLSWMRSISCILGCSTTLQIHCGGTIFDQRRRTPLNPFSPGAMLSSQRRLQGKD